MGAGASVHNTSKRHECKEKIKVVSLPYHHSEDHMNNLLKHLSKFRLNKQLCDVVLEYCENENNNTKQIPAHKCVLAACSGYFGEKFGIVNDDLDTSNNSTNAAQVDCSDIKTLRIDFTISEIIMEAIVTYIYTSDVDLSAEMIPELLKNAVKFKIPSLRRHCVYAIQNGFLLSHFRALIQLSDTLHLPDVRDFSIGQVIERFDEFVDCQCFLELSSEDMQLIVDNRNGVVSSEAMIPEVEAFNAILKWHKEDVAKRNDDAIRLLRSLHYHKIPRNTLSGYVVTHNLVAQDKELMASIQDALGADKRKVLLRLKHLKGGGDESSESDDETPRLDYVPLAPPKPHLLSIGGRMFDQFNSQVFQYNEKHNTWRECTRLPTTLAYHSATVYNDSLYVAGGDVSSISGSRSLANLWRYTPYPDDKWETLTEMQQPRSRFFLGAARGKLLAIGGYSCKVIRNSVEKYDLDTQKWEFAPTLRLPRHSHAGCVHKQAVFINGGITGKEVTSDMLKFNIISNHWETMSPMRCVRNCHSMVSLHDRIYVIGGEDSSMGVPKCTSVAIECYTPQCDQWHTVSTKMPGQSDKEFGCAEFGGKIYIVGGRKVSLSDHKSDVLMYNPESDKWETIAKTPKKICGHCCAVLYMR